MPIGRSTNRSETSKKCTTKDLQDWLVHFNGKTHGIAARLAYTDQITGQVQNMRIELKERPIQTSNNALNTMRHQSKLKEIKQNKYLPVALRWCNLTSGNLSEVCSLRRFTGGHAPDKTRRHRAILWSWKPLWRKRMDLRRDTTIEAILEQLIASGATDLSHPNRTNYVYLLN
jgi:hypothetical protein